MSAQSIANRSAMHWFENFKFDWSLNIGQVFVVLGVVGAVWQALRRGVNSVVGYARVITQLQAKVVELDAQMAAKFDKFDASITSRFDVIEEKMERQTEMMLKQREHDYRLANLERLQGVPPDIMRLGHEIDQPLRHRARPRGEDKQ